MTNAPSDAAVHAAMARALLVARRGPSVGPNPQVGCVILSPDGTQLAEGWHRGAGTPHAEVEALSALGGRADGATAVVTLEPCNHTGRTGPCSEALIAAGVAQVIYAIEDPGERSSGGAERLQQAGIAVSGGTLADEAEQLLHVWLTSVRLRRPYVTLKWASTLDGRIAASDGTSRWITGAAARQRVHEQRAASDAILVGTGTVIADDPSLTARGDAGELLAHQPVAVVVGERPIPEHAAVRRHPHPLVHSPDHDLDALLRRLFADGVRRLYVEGGPTVASAFVAAGLVDEYSVFLAPALLGGARTAIGDIGVESIGDARRLTIHDVERLGDDLMISARPHHWAVSPQTAPPQTASPQQGRTS